MSPIFDGYVEGTHNCVGYAVNAFSRIHGVEVNSITVSEATVQSFLVQQQTPLHVWVKVKEKSMLLGMGLIIDDSFALNDILLQDASGRHCLRTVLPLPEPQLSLGGGIDGERSDESKVGK